jgi:amino acid transporter
MATQNPPLIAGSSAEATDQAGARLKRNSIGVVGIVLMVVACASPLAAIIGNVPLGFALGDGVGMPGAFVVSGILLILFAIGFVAMSPHVNNAAAFYAYVRAGLGRRTGQAAAFVAMLGYNALGAGLLGYVGYFGNSVFGTEFHIHAPWEVYAFGGLVIALALSVAGIDAGVKLLLVLLAVEGTLIAAATIVTFAKHSSNITATSFTPHSVLSGAPGVALMFALVSYIGFEATAVFAEEARDPARTVRRATFIAITVIAVIYTLASMSAVAFYGADKVATADPATFYTAVVTGALGHWSGHAVNVLLLTSLFATLLAVHNMASRYFFGLAREGLLPKAMQRTNRRGAPAQSCIVQAVLIGIVAAIYAMTGQDPYLNLATTMFGIGTIAIVILQAVAGFSAIVFFQRNRRLNSNPFTTIIAPLIGSLGLTLVCYMVIKKFSVLTGSTSSLVNSLPWLVLIVAVIGGLITTRKSRSVEERHTVTRRARRRGACAPPERPRG